jgi:hypothetical protein
MKHTPQKSLALLSRRQLLAKFSLGGTALAALAACGGGGGGDDSDEIDLRAAYDRVVEGMSAAQVIRAVGREPNSTSSDGTMYWSENGQQLDVDINDTTGMTYWVRWDRLTVPIATLRKNFY